MTNCNHKHGPTLTCRHVHVRPHCFILTEACSCRVELAYFAEKYLKLDWSVKMPLHCVGLLWELQAPSNELLITVMCTHLLTDCSTSWLVCLLTMLPACLSSCIFYVSCSFLSLYFLLRRPVFQLSGCLRNLYSLVKLAL